MAEITYTYKLDTLRDGAFGGDLDDISAYVVDMSYQYGMASPYQEVANVSGATLLLDNRAKDFTPEVTGSEEVTNGDFDTANWTGDNPAGWTVTGESAGDPEISEVADYEGHGGSGTGSCNFYATSGTLSVSQAILTTGLTYCVTLRITNFVEGAVRLYCGSTPISPPLRNPGTYLYYFNAGATSLKIESSGAVDITIDDVSCKQTSLYRMISEGMLLRVKGTYSATTKVYYIGKIANIDYGIDPQSGQIGGQSVTLTLADPMTELQRADYQPPLLQNVTADDLLSRMFEDGAVRWPYSSQFWLLDVQGASEVGETTTLYDPTMYSGEAGITTHTFAGDAADRGHGVSCYGYVRDVVEAECGGRFWWEAREGAFQFHSRHHDIINNTVVATLTTSDIEQMNYVQTPELYNKASVNYTQRRVGAAGSVVWEMANLPLKLANGTRRQFTARFSDTSNAEARVGVKDGIKPSPGFDYSAYANSDGTGENLSDKLTVSVEWGATSAKVTFDNRSGQTMYLTTAQLRATPLIAVPATAEAINPDSIYTYDVHEVSVDTRLLSDEITAEAYAQFLVAKFGDPIPGIQSIRFRGYNAATLDFIHNRAIGDRITITDTYTGHDADYIIVGVGGQYRGGSAEKHMATYILKPIAREIFWRVGTANYSEIGQTTRLAF